MPWAPHRLRDAEVYARVDESGRLVADGTGRVEVVYKPAAGAKVYRAAAANLAPVPGRPTLELDVSAPPEAPRPATPPGRTGASAPRAAAPRKLAYAHTPAEGAVQVWTDGACTGNPGPAGLGVVVLDGSDRKEVSEYLGHGTNNIAELTAVLRGLDLVADRDRPVLVYTDSSYSIGVLSMGWKAKANVELVAEIKDAIRRFADVRFVKVPGHAGVPENERCDELARAAITRRR